ncbi:MAG: hypothetical protein ACK5XN_00650 [Bacteroidota bacterium]
MRIYTLTVGDDRYHINLDGLYAVKESGFKESFGYVHLQFGDTNLGFNVQNFKSQEDYRAAVNNLLVAWKGST